MPMCAHDASGSLRGPHQLEAPERLKTAALTRGVAIVIVRRLAHARLHEPAVLRLVTLSALG
jgi:hypothetical protein